MTTAQRPDGPIDTKARPISPATQGDDGEQDVRLRPARLDDFVGQPQVRENLSIAMQAARIRGEALDHVVIYGPPGLGKTTLANIIAHEMGSTIKVTSGPAIERASDIASILTGLQPNDILFIDEIHRLNRAVEEVMYSAMEEFLPLLGRGQGSFRPQHQPAHQPLHPGRSHHPLLPDRRPPPRPVSAPCSASTTIPTTTWKPW